MLQTETSKKRKEISEALERDDVLKVLTQDFLDANYKIETSKKRIGWRHI